MGRKPVNRERLVSSSQGGEFPTSDAPSASDAHTEEAVEPHSEGERSKNLGGRPSLYKPEFAKQALKLCELGATDSELANFFEVSARTIYRWIGEHTEFANALLVAKEVADRRVERSLYHRAIGYNHEAVKIMAVGGKIEKVEYIEHVPPDVTAMIFWLKNRQSKRYADRKNITVRHLDDLNQDELEELLSEFEESEPGIASETGAGRPN